MSSPKIFQSRNFWLLNLTIFVWGFTGILGKVISIQAVELVWFRVLIASITLGLYFIFTKQKISLHRKQFIQLFVSGGIIALHWIFFFHAIKISTVSVALVCLSSATLFTSVIEPLVKKHAIAKLDMLIGTVIILGIYLIFKFESQYYLGIICGLIAAVLSSLFSSLCAVYSQQMESKTITLVQMIGAFFWITLYRLLTGNFDKNVFHLSANDWISLLILGTICTAFAFVISVKVMQEFNAFTVILYTNLEPIYGIIIATFLFGGSEKMSLGFYFGAAIILSCVFLYPSLRRNIHKLKPKNKRDLQA